MALYVKNKASKLALLIYARTKVPVSAKRARRFTVRLYRSIKHASSVKEAIACVRTVVDSIVGEHRYRTKYTWDICKERVEDLWAHGDLGPLSVLRHDGLYKLRTLHIYFDAVARTKTDALYESMMKHFLDLFLLECGLKMGMRL
jgi:hypothetical protein